MVASLIPKHIVNIDYGWIRFSKNPSSYNPAFPFAIELSILGLVSESNLHAANCMLGFRTIVDIVGGRKMIRFHPLVGYLDRLLKKRVRVWMVGKTQLRKILKIYFNVLL